MPTTPGVTAVACLPTMADFPVIFSNMLLLTFLVLLGPAVIDIRLLQMFSPLLVSFLFYQLAAGVNNTCGVPVVACLPAIAGFPAIFSIMLLLAFLVLLGPDVTDRSSVFSFHAD